MCEVLLTKLKNRIPLKQCTFISTSKICWRLLLQNLDNGSMSPCLSTMSWKHTGELKWSCMQF